MSELVPTKAQPIFRKDHELADLLKRLKKLSKKTIEVLEQGLESTDERIRQQAANKIMDYLINVSKEVNQDQLNRLVLDIKAQGLVGAGTTAPEDDNTPKLDFDNIHPDFADAEVVDMSDVRAVK
jgi:hypothetical protein